MIGRVAISLIDVPPLTDDPSATVKTSYNRFAYRIFTLVVGALCRTDRALARIDPAASGGVRLFHLSSLQRYY
jgi:hypothetical protein